MRLRLHYSKTQKAETDGLGVLFAHTDWFCTGQTWHELRPMTSRNFLELAKSGRAKLRHLREQGEMDSFNKRYYDGCIIHRVVKGFMCHAACLDIALVAR